jgi:hypothetical protein
LFSLEAYKDSFLQCNTLYSPEGALVRMLPNLLVLDMQKLAPQVLSSHHVGDIGELSPLLSGIPFHYSILKLSMMVKHSILRQQDLESGRSAKRCSEYPQSVVFSTLTRYEEAQAHPTCASVWRSYTRSICDIVVADPQLISPTSPLDSVSDLIPWIKGNPPYTVSQSNWNLFPVTESSPVKSYRFSGPTQICVGATEDASQDFVTAPLHVVSEKKLEILNQYLDFFVFSNVGATYSGSTVQPWSGRKYPIVGRPVSGGHFLVKGDYYAAEIIHSHAAQFARLVLVDFTFAHYVTLHALNVVFVSNLEASTVAYQYLVHYVQQVGGNVVRASYANLGTLAMWDGLQYFFLPDFV